MRKICHLLLLCFASVSWAAPTSPELEALAIEEGLSTRFCSFISEGDRGKTIAEAEKQFAALLEANPSDAGLYVIYGRFSWEFGDQANALPSYRRAFDLEPTNVPALQLLGQCYVRDGRLREALETFRKAAAVDPSNAQLQFDIANLFLTLSNEVPATSREAVVLAALRYYRVAVDLDPRNAAYVQAFGEAIDSMPRPDWALSMSVWQRVRSLSPDTDMANYHLARAALRLGKKDDAEKFFSQIPFPRRDELARYLRLETGTEEKTAEAAAIAPAADPGPTVVTKGGGG